MPATFSPSARPLGLGRVGEGDHGGQGGEHQRRPQSLNDPQHNQDRRRGERAEANATTVNTTVPSTKTRLRP